ncbi:MAG: hypothetical protein P8J32_00770 [bacterium]|jgi:hypothetical protein|nr:hypothetical protein [bacterium]
MAQAALSTAADRSSRLKAGRFQSQQRAPVDRPPAANNNLAFGAAKAAAGTVANSVASQVGGNVINLENYRRAKFIQSQAAQKMQAPGDNNEPTFEDALEDEFNNEDGLDQQASQQNQIAQFLKQTMRARNRVAQEEAFSAEKQKEVQETRDFIKKEAKAAFRRGAIAIVDMIAAALDISSAGISFIIDIFIYMFTLGWLNLEMIYGTHLAKKKSKYVSPISWAPIPMPVDKDAILLQGFIVAADILLVVTGIGLGLTGLCLMHDMIQIQTNTVQVIGSGGANLCLSTVVMSMLGL